MQQYPIVQSHDYLHMIASAYRNGSLLYLDKSNHYLEIILERIHIFIFYKLICFFIIITTIIIIIHL